MLLDKYSSFLDESLNTTPLQEFTESEIISDVEDILENLSPDDIRKLSLYVMGEDTVSDPETFIKKFVSQGDLVEGMQKILDYFMEDDDEDEEEDDEELDETIYFKTRKKELARERRKNKVELKKLKKLRKKYYRKNKMKLKRKQKIYKKKVKSGAIKPRKHRD